MTIVVGIDGSAGSEHALVWAVDEARRRRADLLLVHGWTYAIGGHPATSRTLALLAEAAQALTDLALAEARSLAPDLHVEASVVPRSPVHALVEASAGTDLLVVGSHGRGELGAAVLGSVADACARHAPVPVAVIRPAAVDDASAHVVVGVDGSQPSRRALRWARDEAHLRGVPLLAVHAWLPPAVSEVSTFDESDIASWQADAASTIEQAIIDTADADGVDPAPLVVRDTPAGALLGAADGAAMIVVGSRGHGGFTGLIFGSVSHRCLHAATCPVVVVR
jgi:nucleotide-binding universal stress UspA family protein